MGVLDTFSHWYLSKIRYNVCRVMKYVMKSTTKKITFFNFYSINCCTPLELFTYPRLRTSGLVYSNKLGKQCGQEFENEKSQIVGSGKWCVQNKERVSKSNKSYYICMIRLKRLFVKYKVYVAFSVYQTLNSKLLLNLLLTLSH